MLRKRGKTCEVFKEPLTDIPEYGWFENDDRTGKWLTLLNKPVGIMCINDYWAHELVARAPSRHCGYRRMWRSWGWRITN